MRSRLRIPEHRGVLETPSVSSNTRRSPRHHRHRPNLVVTEAGASQGDRDGDARRRLLRLVRPVAPRKPSAATASTAQSSWAPPDLGTPHSVSSTRRGGIAERQPCHLEAGAVDIDVAHGHLGHLTGGGHRLGQRPRSRGGGPSKSYIAAARHRSNRRPSTGEVPADDGRQPSPWSVGLDHPDLRPTRNNIRTAHRRRCRTVADGRSTLARRGVDELVDHHRPVRV